MGERARDFLSEAITREDPGRRFLRSSFSPETGRLARLLAVLEVVALRDHIVSDQRLESCTRVVDHVGQHRELEHAQEDEGCLFSPTIIFSQASTEASEDLESDHSVSDTLDEAVVVVETIKPVEKCLRRSKSEGSGASRVVEEDVLSFSVPATPTPRPAMHVSCPQGHRGALAVAMPRGTVHQGHMIFQKCSTRAFDEDQMALCARTPSVPLASQIRVQGQRSGVPSASRNPVSSRRGSSTTTGEFKGRCMKIASQAVGEIHSTPLRRVRVLCPRTALEHPIHCVRVAYPVLRALPMQMLFSVPVTVTCGPRAIVGVAVLAR